ncbi:hypothetical protein HDV00_005882 [Rhizophlyctis rosea]|nr:hypothetical protein HDV00_005882 [Rhizophlyctis rosea]
MDEAQAAGKTGMPCNKWRINGWLKPVKLCAEAVAEAFRVVGKESRVFESLTESRTLSHYKARTLPSSPPPTSSPTKPPSPLSSKLPGCVIFSGSSNHTSMIRPPGAEKKIFRHNDVAYLE